jgi:large subunit ribosomal protein L6
MSRIGRLPIKIPKGVEVKIDGLKVTVKGPKGTLEREFLPLVEIVKEEDTLYVKRKGETKKEKSVHGLTRALLNNMVVGVSEGFTKKLQVLGVGYRVQLKGNNIVFNVGYSHPVEVKVPEGLSCSLEGDKGKENILVITGHDKEQLGQFAANLRKIRPPEPYKGKGIRYLDEYVRKKAGKRGVK